MRLIDKYNVRKRNPGLKKWYAEHASYIMYLLKPNDAQCTLEHNSHTLLYTWECQHRAYSVTGLTKPLAVVMDNFGKEGPHNVM